MNIKVTGADDIELSELPKWSRDDQGLYVCGNEDMIMVRHIFAFYGFNLPKFDIWLADIPDCGMKKELIERRSDAWNAMKNNSRDAALRHLEWMMLRRMMVQLEDRLLPLAQAGEQAERHTRKRLSGLEAVNAAKDEAKNRAQAIAREYWRADTKQEIRTGEMANRVWRQVVDEGYSDSLPDTLKVFQDDWIAPVAPAYARKRGRPKKK